MEEEDSHGTVGAVDGGGHVCVGLFDQHGGGVVSTNGGGRCENKTETGTVDVFFSLS